MISIATKSGLSYIFSRQLYLNTLVTAESKQLIVITSFYSLTVRGILIKSVDTIILSFSNAASGRLIIGTVDFAHYTFFLKNSLPPMTEI